jgi:diguanylate cyclase (GGDEF)-like protein
MSGFKTASTTSTPGEGLFSTLEIQRLMRVEFERAQRYKYPIVCMKIGVDRFAALQDLYGLESKQEILHALIDLLRSVIRDSDFLAYLHDDRLLAVFPHTPPTGAPLLARRLCDGARAMAFDSDGRSLRVTLSIGVAHNGHPGSLSFETLVQVADEGLAVADAAGGDRFVETELYQLYENKRRRGEPLPAELRPSHQLMAVPAWVQQRHPVEPPPPTPADLRPPEDPALRTLSDKLYALIASDGADDAGITSAEKVLIFKALQSMTPAEPPAALPDSEYRREVELLQRRLSKLQNQLGMTEEELKRVAKMKNIDLGVHSIYRSVQGLSDDEGQAELKRAMMSSIFEANVQLKKRIASQAG